MKKHGWSRIKKFIVEQESQYQLPFRILFLRYLTEKKEVIESCVIGPSFRTFREAELVGTKSMDELKRHYRKIDVDKQVRAWLNQPAQIAL